MDIRESYYPCDCHSQYHVIKIFLDYDPSKDCDIGSISICNFHHVEMEDSWSLRGFIRRLKAAWNIFRHGEYSVADVVLSPSTARQIAKDLIDCADAQDGQVQKWKDDHAK